MVLLAAGKQIAFKIVAKLLNIGYMSFMTYHDEL